jgi:hypothetical protein
MCVPLSSICSVVNGLRGVRQLRLYAEGTHAHDVRKKIATIIEEG